MKIEGVMNSRDGHLYNPNKRHEITTFTTTRGEGYKASVTIIFQYCEVKYVDGNKILSFQWKKPSFKKLPGWN